MGLVRFVVGTLDEYGCAVASPKPPYGLPHPAASHKLALGEISGYCLRIQRAS